jgi:hypothetical protein
MLPASAQRVQRWHFLFLKCSRRYLGGVDALDGGLISHVEIIRQLLDGEAPAIGVEPPHTVVEPTRHRLWDAAGSSQPQAFAELPDVGGVFCQRSYQAISRPVSR